MDNPLFSTDHPRRFLDRRFLLGPCLTLTLSFLFLLSLLIVPRNSVQAGNHVIYVDQNATGNPDGTSWTTAYTDVQDALTVASSGSEIWVAAGTYRPTDGTDRTASFELGAGVALYGGFAGTEASRAERNWLANETILSGDIGVPGDASDNSYHVVRTVSGEAPILDGFTISGGNADASITDDRGGGMLNEGSSPIVSNVIFRGNSAAGGGGMANINAQPTLHNVLFSGNVASGDGGGMLNNLSDATLTLSHVTFNGNFAAVNGGGMVNIASSPTIVNSILWGNADQGGTGTGQEAQIFNQPGTPVSAPKVSYSLIQGDPVYPGTGNINNDPLFVSPVEPGTVPTTTGNLRLQRGSPAIDSGSDVVPADASDMDGDGDSAEQLPYDLDGNPRVIGYLDLTTPRVDMGAYETLTIDVRLVKVVSSSTALPEERITYTLYYSNMGTDVAEGVMITDAVPDNLTDITVGTSDPNVEQTGTDPYTWQVPDLAEGSGGTIILSGVLNKGLAAGTTIVNRAGISTSSNDLDTRNNESSVPLMVRNAQPLARGDAATTPEDTPVDIPVLGNDYDANGDALTLAEAGTPSNGTVTIEENQLRYTPGANFAGTDHFTYRVSDGTAVSEPATVTVTVSPVNDPPSVRDADFYLLENSPDGTGVGKVTATDPDGDTLHYSLQGGNEDGVFALDAEDGQITLTDSSKLDSQVTPTYTITVGVSDGTLSDTGKMIIHVVTHRETFIPILSSCPGTAETYEQCQSYSQNPGALSRDP